MEELNSLFWGNMRLKTKTCDCQCFLDFLSGPASNGKDKLFQMWFYLEETCH